MGIQEESKEEVQHDEPIEIDEKSDREEKEVKSPKGEQEKP